MAKYFDFRNINVWIALGYLVLSLPAEEADGHLHRVVLHFFKLKPLVVVILHFKIILNKMETMSPLFNGNNLEEWQRVLTKDETVLKLKLSTVGNHQVFCFEMGKILSLSLSVLQTVVTLTWIEIDNLRNWPPLAMKFLLLDMVGPRGPGSGTQCRQSSGKGVAFFLIISLEDCAWKAVPLFLASMMPPADLLSSLIISSNDFSIETPQASLSTPQANPATITEVTMRKITWIFSIFKA